MTLGELAGRLGIDAPASADKPLLSLLFEHFGKIPEEDDTFLYDRLEITVGPVEGGRIGTVDVHLLSEDELDARRAEENGEEAASE
jgi:CBS domain containing-hemolysin-like protein